MFGDEARVPAARQADFAVSSRHWRLAELSVQGMTCTACSTAVERALRSMDGVRSASVVLLREMAEVEYDSSMIDPPKLVDAVENIGFTAALRTSNSASSHIQVAQFRIQGMHCSSCSTSVEENVSKLPGVLKVSVALTLGEARVTFDRHTTTENDIVMAIEGAGFEAGIIENKSASKVTFELEENYIDTVDTIEKTISTYPGVAEVAVDIIESSIEITFHQEVTGPRDLLRRLEEDGYQARLASNGEGLLDRQRSEAAHWKFLFLASLVFTVPVFAFAMILPKISGMQGLLKLEVWGFPFGVLTKWILTTPVQFVIGWRFQAGAYK